MRISPPTLLYFLPCWSHSGLKAVESVPQKSISVWCSGVNRGLHIVSWWKKNESNFLFFSLNYIFFLDTIFQLSKTNFAQLFQISHFVDRGFMKIFTKALRKIKAIATWSREYNLGLATGHGSPGAQVEIKVPLSKTACLKPTSHAPALSVSVLKATEITLHLQTKIWSFGLRTLPTTTPLPFLFLL